jgi:Immunoglobulin domain
VFDSNVYTPLSDVAPVLAGDSGQAQHMAVMKDFLISVTDTGITNPPAITAQSQSQSVSPDSNVTFTITADGTVPLTYQWLFNSENISGATTNPFILNNVQFTSAGNYSVVVTNIAGAITSSIAVLTVSNYSPVITTQPKSQTVSIGSAAAFTVAAGGTAPLSYQWCLSGTNIPGANTNLYTRSGVQTNDAGNYSVIIANAAGSVTSSVAALTVLVTNSVIIAQWNWRSIQCQHRRQTEYHHQLGSTRQQHRQQICPAAIHHQRNRLHRLFRRYNRQHNFRVQREQFGGHRGREQ